MGFAVIDISKVYSPALGFGAALGRAPTLWRALCWVFLLQIVQVALEPLSDLCARGSLGGVFAVDGLRVELPLERVDVCAVFDRALKRHATLALWRFYVVAERREGALAQLVLALDACLAFARRADVLDAHRAHASTRHTFSAACRVGLAHVTVAHNHARRALDVGTGLGLWTGALTRLNTTLLVDASATHARLLTARRATRVAFAQNLALGTTLTGSSHGDLVLMKRKKYTLFTLYY